MKYLYPVFAIVLMAANVRAQALSDIVATGAGYADEIWYSAENGEVHSAPHDNWDLAFQINGFASSIRINGAKGVELFAAPYAIGEWADLDTAGMAALWPQLHNDPKNWERGAFNLNSTSEFDLGWGIYNFVTHHVVGDSTYVIGLADGSYKKLRIDVLASGTYTFTYSDLDGGNETEAQLVKSQFSGKNFGYFNFETGETVDREPISADWDLAFTRWIDMIGPDGDTPYGVTGVLHNQNVRSSRAANTPVDESSPWDFSMSDDINTIGWDWKTFDFTQGFVIEEDLSFFVEAQNGNIYHLVFDSFEGSSTGVYEFTIDMASALSTAETDFAEARLYPNPASRSQAVRIDAGDGSVEQVRVFDLTGKMVYSQNAGPFANTAELSLNHLPEGTYLVHLEGTSGASVKKLILTP